MLSWVREKIAEGRLRWQQTSQQVRFEQILRCFSFLVFFLSIFYSI